MNRNHTFLETIRIEDCKIKKTYGMKMREEGVEKIHVLSVCLWAAAKLDGQMDKHKIGIIFSVKDSWLSHIFTCLRSPKTYNIVFSTKYFYVLFWWIYTFIHIQTHRLLVYNLFIIILLCLFGKVSWSTLRKL